jgi:hypothetical protein
MLEIFIKVIITVLLTYGAAWLLFSGHAVKPFIPKESINPPMIRRSAVNPEDPEEDLEPETTPIRELVGVVLTIVGVTIILGMLISITWVL